MDDKIHIVYGTDDNYVFPTTVSAASAAHFAQDKAKLVIHLFDAGMTDAHYAEYAETIRKVAPEVTLIRHVLKPETFVGFGDWKGSVVTYSRMFMAEILSDVDWAVYLDGDTLWLGDPAALWALRDDAKLVLASVDPPSPMGNDTSEFDWYRARGLEVDPAGYLCMGLMLANLKRMREENLPARCRAFMAKYPCPRVVDQTVLNYLCQGEMAALPKNWGVFSTWHGGVDLSQPGIVHYVSDVPWRRAKVNKLFSDVVLLWFAFCRRVLGRDELAKFPAFDRWWRRALFVFLKHNQWLLSVHPFVKSRFRNTHGISKAERERIAL